MPVIPWYYHNTNNKSDTLQIIIAVIEVILLVNFALLFHRWLIQKRTPIRTNHFAALNWSMNNSGKYISASEMSPSSLLQVVGCAAWLNSWVRLYHSAPWWDTWSLSMNIYEQQTANNKCRYAEQQQREEPDRWEDPAQWLPKTASKGAYSTQERNYFSLGAQCGKTACQQDVVGMKSCWAEPEPDLQKASSGGGKKKPLQPFSLQAIPKALTLQDEMVMNKEVVCISGL